METNPGKENLPAWCEGCNQQDHFFVDDFDQPCFIVCERCGWETSYGWMSIRTPVQSYGFPLPRE
jgi:hypothetical protein